MPPNRLRLLAGDRARICVSNDNIQCNASFTSDRDELSREVERIGFGNGSRLYDALSDSTFTRITEEVQTQYALAFQHRWTDAFRSSPFASRTITSKVRARRTDLADARR
jgi:hypothetical protein